MMKIDPAIVRTLREQRAWSQERLAQIAGVSVRTVQRIENGGGASLETRMALAAALEVEPAALCTPAAAGDDGEPGTTGPHMSDDAFRRAVVGIGLVIVFAMFLLFGYLFGRDLANRDNRVECEAAGRTDCR